MPLKQVLKWMIWSPLFYISAYPEEQRELLTECKRRIDEANSKYRIARFREDMFAKGLKAGMYFCTFDRDENLLGFEFNGETRQMLGYLGLTAGVYGTLNGDH